MSVGGQRLQARDIEPKLKELCSIAATVEPGLANRLEEIRLWIKDIRPGLLMRKKFLIAFLLEVIKDAEFWLALKDLTDEERQFSLNGLAPTVRYWYSYLFPKWFNERDRRFYIWKQKLRSEEFEQEDAELLKSIAREITSREGTVVQRYVADFSMATDAIVSNDTGNPLCVQLTTMSDQYSQNKSLDWEKTLRGWEIKRGIFVSYNPGRNEFVVELVNLVLYNSKNLPEDRYLKFSF